VRQLNLEQSIAEIARLSGGADTELAIPHARKIKERAEERKNQMKSILK
jgi:DNA repair ATPase RecN